MRDAGRRDMACCDLRLLQRAAAFGVHRAVRDGDDAAAAGIDS